MREYSLHGIVGREATVRAAAGAREVEKLRFGLAFAEIGDEPAGGPATFVEFVRLSPPVADLARQASLRGPLAYIEAESGDGAGYHAAVAWRDGGMVYGPRGVEEREPVNAVLRLLGVVPDAGLDEMETVGLPVRAEDP